MHIAFLKKYGFMAGLILVPAATAADPSGILAGAGKWLCGHYGPGLVIFCIFLFSGFLLNAADIRSGLTDYEIPALTLAVIFIAGPLLAAALVRLPLEEGLKIGLLLTAVMPTTLSSGVVMTGAAGGNMAQALVITVLANGFCVLTIPFTLPLLLTGIGEASAVSIDRTAIMLKLFGIVLIPLIIGISVKMKKGKRLPSVERRLQAVNQSLILVIVWMAVSRSLEAMSVTAADAALISLLSIGYHAGLLGIIFFVSSVFRIGPGRRESVIFMGGQKTLTLAVILQTSLFPRYGIALSLCVIHHILHLIMDSYLAGRLKGKFPSGMAGDDGPDEKRKTVRESG